MNRFLAAAIQMNSQPDVNHNMKQVGEQIKKAAYEGAAFAALPENFAFLGDEEEKHRQAENIAEHVMEQLPKWAKEYGLTILAGGFPVRSDSSKVYNRAMLFDAAGDILGQYDKIHLFDISLSKEESYQESELVEAGQHQAIVCDTDLGLNPHPAKRYTGDKSTVKRDIGDDKPGTRIGLSICYDIRFPELYRKLSEQGADVLCVPSAFTRPTGEAHWEVLLRARAIENSAYVIAPAQTGLHGKKRTTHGHSMIIDPWGRVLADAGTGPGTIFAEIDTAYLQDVRQKLPSLKHRVM